MSDSVFNLKYLYLQSDKRQSEMKSYIIRVIYFCGGFRNHML